jgi:hypothetical protein
MGLKERLLTTVTKNLFAAGLMMGTALVVKHFVVPFIVNSGLVSVHFGG